MGVVQVPDTPKKHAGFQPGQIANPKGRPKGAKGKLTELKVALETAMVEQLQDDIQEILGKAVKMAKKGDKAMIKFVLERFIPKAGTREDTDPQGVGGIVINVTSLDQLEVKPAIEQEPENAEHQG